MSYQRSVGSKECVRDGGLLELLAKSTESAELYRVLLTVTTAFIEVGVAFKRLV